MVSLYSTPKGDSSFVGSFMRASILESFRNSIGITIGVCFGFLWIAEPWTHWGYGFGGGWHLGKAVLMVISGAAIFTTGIELGLRYIEVATRLEVLQELTKGKRDVSFPDSFRVIFHFWRSDGFLLKFLLNLHWVITAYALTMIPFLFIEVAISSLFGK